jgi:transposase
LLTKPRNVGLSIDELEKRYRQAQEGIERSHSQIIWLLAQGHTTAEVAEITSYSLSWIYELVWGYNRIGTESLGDKLRENRGKPALLNEVQRAQLWQALQEPPADGDLWDGPKVAQTIGWKNKPDRVFC